MSNLKTTTLPDFLNRDCQCISLNRAELAKNLEGLLGPEHGQLFADQPVFVGSQHIETMALVIEAIDSVTKNPGYLSEVLARSSGLADVEPYTSGVFYGFDFHLGDSGPQLIEVNTNAGGALLNAHVALAQRACCPPVAELFEVGVGESAATSFAEMFQTEWSSFRSALGIGRELHRIALVDESPTEQFLYPEFQLFDKLLASQGLDVVVCDPQELVHEGDQLLYKNQSIDLVYNRLTDFYLQHPTSAALRSAYEARAVALTPAPRHYALFADKRNLSVFSNPAQMTDFGIDAASIAVLTQHVPRTTVVADIASTDEGRDQLWAGRKKLFFKPATGHASRGAYDGAKMTRKVFDQILGQPYVAQDKIPPSTRTLTIDGEEKQLKVDLRAVVYRGQIQQVSARLYRGQTTNMRTPGGGLAAVFTTPPSTTPTTTPTSTTPTPEK